jgi:seryl-tRNA synthetase
MSEIIESGRDMNADESKTMVKFFSENQNNLEEKLERTAKYIRNLEAESKAIADEIDRLEKKKKSRENAAKNLKQNINYVLKNIGVDKVKAGIFDFRIQKNPPALNITGKVPDKFLIPQPAKVDNAGIKQAIKDGATFDWCELVSSESLRISCLNPFTQVNHSNGKQCLQIIKFPK